MLLPFSVILSLVVLPLSLIAAIDDGVWCFLSDPGVPGVRSMGPDVTQWLQDYVQT